MLLCVIDGNNIIVNKLEAPYLYEDNQREWEEWHTIGEAYSDTPPLPTQEEIIAGFISIVQKHLDTTAQQRGYDSITTLATYKGSVIPKFNKEGTAGANWRDAVWAKCYLICDEVLAGTRSMPTDIISELPIFTWGD